MKNEYALENETETEKAEAKVREYRIKYMVDRLRGLKTDVHYRLDRHTYGDFSDVVESHLRHCARRQGLVLPWDADAKG